VIKTATAIIKKENQMKTFDTGQIIGIILIATAILDTYILPRILLKRFDQTYQNPAATPQEKAENEQKRKTMKLIIVVVTSVPAILGLLFFLGIIPIQSN
jgi:hypothetical protein